MSAITQQDLLLHIAHRIEIAYYGNKHNPYSVTIECIDCNEVLFGIEGEQIKPLPEKGTPEWHKLQIAKKTVTMNPVIVAILGTPSMEEARKTLKEYGL